MSQYTTGTANVVNGSATVNGTSTLWSANVAAGDLFIIVGESIVYEVSGVTSNTQLTLTAPYGGNTANAQDYVIARDFTPINNIPYINRGDVETAAILKKALQIIDGLI